MRLTELLIIYLACGSPFGVFKISQCGVPGSIREFVVVGAHFAFWPIFAAMLFRRWLLDQSESVKTDLDNEIRLIRDQLELIAYTSRSTSAVFEFRQVFARFTGLTLALNSGGDSTSVHPLFAIDGRQDARIATACIDRRDRQRIAFHQVQARNDFVDLISLLALAYPAGSEIIDLGLRLAKLLDDQETVNDLSMYLPVNSMPTIERSAENVITHASARSSIS